MATSKAARSPPTSPRHRQQPTCPEPDNSPAFVSGFLFSLFIRCWFQGVVFAVHLHEH